MFMVEEKSREEGDYYRAITRRYNVMSWGWFLLLLSVPLFFQAILTYGEIAENAFMIIMLGFMIGTILSPFFANDSSRNEFWRSDKVRVKSSYKSIMIMVIGCILSFLITWTWFYIANEIWNETVFFEGWIPFIIMLAFTNIFYYYFMKRTGDTRTKYFRSVSKEELERATTDALNSLQYQFTSKVVKSVLWEEETIFNVDPSLRIDIATGRVSIRPAGPEGLARLAWIERAIDNAIMDPRTKSSASGQ